MRGQHRRANGLAPPPPTTPRSSCRVEHVVLRRERQRAQHRRQQFGRSAAGRDARPGRRVAARGDDSERAGERAAGGAALGEADPRHVRAGRHGADADPPLRHAHLGRSRRPQSAAASTPASRPGSSLHHVQPRRPVGLGCRRRGIGLGQRHAASRCARVAPRLAPAEVWRASGSDATSRSPRVSASPFICQACTSRSTLPTLSRRWRAPSRIR